MSGTERGTDAGKLGDLSDISARCHRMATGIQSLRAQYEETRQTIQIILTEMNEDIAFFEGLDVTEAQLQETGVGKAVNKLSRSFKSVIPLLIVQKRAGKLLATWKAKFEVASPVARRSSTESTTVPLDVSETPRNVIAAPDPQSIQCEPPIREHYADFEERCMAELRQNCTPQEYQTRKKARRILETRLMPPGEIVPAHVAASMMEKSLLEHFKEDDLASGKLYLRRLLPLASCLSVAENDPKKEECRKYFVPGLRELVAKGRIHPADLPCMSQECMRKAVEELAETRTS